MKHHPLFVRSVAVDTTLKITERSVMRSIHTSVALMCCIFIAACTDDEPDTAALEACGIGSIGPVREISFGQAVNTATCKLKGFKTKKQALASLRTAGVCPLHIELRRNPNNGFPCELFGPAYYFYAQIPQTQLLSAVNAGWRDRYSKLAINNSTFYREFLLGKQADLALEVPDCNCSNEHAQEACDGQLYNDCLRYLMNKQINEDIQTDIDKINEYLLNASKATGSPVSCEESVRVDPQLSKDDIAGTWGNEAPFILDSSSYRIERYITLKPDFSFEEIEYYYFEEDQPFADTKYTRHQCRGGDTSSLCSMWRSEKHVTIGTYSFTSNVITLQFFDDAYPNGLLKEKYHVNRLPDHSLTLAFGAACQIVFQRQ